MWSMGIFRKIIRVVFLIFLMLFITAGFSFALKKSAAAESTARTESDNEICLSLPDKTGEPVCIALSPDGKKLIVCNKTQIFRMSVDNRHDIEKIGYKGINISSVIWSNKGRYIAFIDNQKSGFYDFNKGKYFRFPIDYYYYQPEFINFTGDDRYLTVGCATKENGNQIVLINTEDGKIFKRVNAIPSPDVALSDDGTILYSLRSSRIDKNQLDQKGRGISINLLSGSINEEIDKDAAIFRKESFSDWAGTITTLKLRKNKVIQRIYELMPMEAKKIIDNYQSGFTIDDETKTVLVDGFNKILVKPDFCNDGMFWSLTLSSSDRKKYKNGISKLKTGEIMMFNRTLIEKSGIGKINRCGYIALKSFIKFFDTNLKNLILTGNGKIYTLNTEDGKYSYKPIPFRQYSASFIKSSSNSLVCLSERVNSSKPGVWVYIFDYNSEKPGLLKVWTEGPFTMSPSGNYVAYTKRKQVIVSKIPVRTSPEND